MKALSYILLVLVALALSGCGTKGIYYATSLNEISEADANPTDRPAASAVGSPRSIAIRWPAIVSPAARPEIIANAHKWIGVSMLPSIMEDYPPFAALPELIEASSTLYAAELYWAIRRFDSSIQVILEPQYVDLDSTGTARLLPLTDNAIPVDLVADLWVSTESFAVLIGQMFYFSLQSAPIRSKGNCGLLMATVGHEPTADVVAKVPCSSENVRNELQSHYFLNGIERPRPMVLLPNANTLPLSMDRVFLARSQVLSDGGLAGANATDYIKNSRPQRLSDADSAPVHPIADALARVTVSALSVIDPASGTPQTMASYAEQFDKNLAEALRINRVLTPSEQRNLRVLRLMLAQELKVRTARDDRVAREIFAGAFGRQFRRARDQAYQQFDKQMSDIWLSGLAALSLQASLMATGSGALGSLNAINRASDLINQQWEKVGLDYVRGIAPSVSTLGGSTVSVLEDNLLIDIADQEALRAGLTKLYQKQKRRSE